MEIEVGKKYVVGTVPDEEGNVIEITGFNKGVFTYKTVIAHTSGKVVSDFERNSGMAKGLTPYGEKKIVITIDPESNVNVRLIENAVEMKSVTLLAESETLENIAKKGLNALFAKSSMSRDDIYEETKVILSTTPPGFDWEAFKNGDVFVSVSRDTIGDFLERCETKKLTWRDGKSASNVNLFRQCDSMGKIERMICVRAGIGLGENVWISVTKDGHLAFEPNKPEGNIFVW